MCGATEVASRCNYGQCNDVSYSYFSALACSDTALRELFLVVRHVH